MHKTVLLLLHRLLRKASEYEVTQKALKPVLANTLRFT